MEGVSHFDVAWIDYYYKMEWKLNFRYIINLDLFGI